MSNIKTSQEKSSEAQIKGMIKGEALTPIQRQEEVREAIKAVNNYLKTSSLYDEQYSSILYSLTNLLYPKAGNVIEDLTYLIEKLREVLLRPDIFKLFHQEYLPGSSLSAAYSEASDHLKRLESFFYAVAEGERHRAEMDRFMLEYAHGLFEDEEIIRKKSYYATETKLALLRRELEAKQDL